MEEVGEGKADTRETRQVQEIGGYGAQVTLDNLLTSTSLGDSK